MRLTQEGRFDLLHQVLFPRHLSFSVERLRMLLFRFHTNPRFDVARLK